MKYAIKAAGKIVDLEICDEIHSMSPCNAAYVREALKANPDATLIRVRFNSVGGDVDEGSDIYRSLVDHPARVEGYVTGLAASMASVILCACDYVRIAQGAEIMVHNPWTVAKGNAADFEKLSKELDARTKDLVAIYIGRTGKTESEVVDWMNGETYFDSATAVSAGFADEIVKVKTAPRDLTALKISSLKRPSDSLLRAVAKAKATMDPQLLEALGLAAGAPLDSVLAAIVALKDAAKAAEPVVPPKEAPAEGPPKDPKEDPMAAAMALLPPAVQASIMGRLAAAEVAGNAARDALLPSVPTQFKAWAAKQDVATVKAFLSQAGISASIEPVRPVVVATAVTEQDRLDKEMAKACGLSVAKIKENREKALKARSDV